MVGQPVATSLPSPPALRRARVDIPLVVPHERTCRVQEAHLFIGHALCEMVEEKLPRI